METALRTALLEWLRADPVLSSRLNQIAEEAPTRASLPWLGIVASASSDWSTKDTVGREVRLALEMHGRGDAPGTLATLIAALEERIAAMPPGQGNFEIVTSQFLRSRAEQRPGNIRAMLMEYRFRLLAA